MKKFLALALAAALLCGTLAACSKQEDTGKKDSNDSVSDSAPEETDLFVKDDLPSGLDFGGETINILWWEETEPYCNDMEETAGDIVKEALYSRDRTVEDRIGVTINNIGMSYTWDTQNVYLGAIRNSAVAADGAYDIVSGQYATMPSLISDGNMLNLMGLEYLNFEKPWWVRGLTEETTIDGKLYFVSGDITTVSIQQVACNFYNKNLLETLNIPDPVAAVEDGKWTIDYFMDILKNTYDDVSGDGNVDLKDQFGYIVPSGNSITPYIQAFDLKITTMNEEGYPEFTFGTDKVISAVTMLNEFLHDTNIARIGTDSTVASLGAVFEEGRACFISSAFGAAKDYSKSDTIRFTFGIAPLPKWDEAQENYYTALGESNTIFGILSSCKHVDATAAAMEAMASESYRQVSPAYYETALKVKYSPDDDLGKMFDLIREGVLFNFGSIYGFQLSQVNVKFKQAIESNTNNWASSSASWEKAYTTAVDKLFADVQNLPD